MSSNYQYSPWGEPAPQSAGYLYPAVRQMLGNDRSRRILDMGCGNGNIANCLIAEGFDVFGIDGSETGIEVARQKNPERFFVHDVSVDNLPAGLGDKPFDVVISTEVIEHVYAPRAFMALVRKSLHPKHGTFIVSTPYHGYLKDVALAVTGSMDKHYTALWDGGHIKFWSRRTLTALLEEFDFKVTEFRGAGRLPYLWKSMILKAQVTGR